MGLNFQDRRSTETTPNFLPAISSHLTKFNVKYFLLGYFCETGEKLCTFFLNLNILYFGIRTWWERLSLFLKSIISFASFPAHLRLGQSIKISSRERRFRKQKCTEALHRRPWGQVERTGAKLFLINWGLFLDWEILYKYFLDLFLDIFLNLCTGAKMNLPQR